MEWITEGRIGLKEQSIKFSPQCGFLTIGHVPLSLSPLDVTLSRSAYPDSTNLLFTDSISYRISVVLILLHISASFSHCARSWFPTSLYQPLPQNTQMHSILGYCSHVYIYSLIYPFSFNRSQRKIKSALRELYSS